MWPAEDRWRAPVGDFPPPWASAWGEDAYGLWADLTVNGATQRMRWIEPSGLEGFLMGAPQAERDAIEDEEIRAWATEREHEPRREVVEHGLWLADTPCTEEFWEAVTSENSAHFQGDRPFGDHPVKNVSWEDVMDSFMARFAQTPEWGTEDRICLPSETVWEYAARAGTRTAYWWGDLWDDARGNAGRRWKMTSPVKHYAPNPWGLYDIHGNVWEWCADVWRKRRDAVDNRPDREVHVARGGSWLARTGCARSAYRVWRTHGFADQSRGFRFALRTPAPLMGRVSGATRSSWSAYENDFEVAFVRALGISNQSGYTMPLWELAKRELEHGRVELANGDFANARVHFENAFRLSEQFAAPDPQVAALELELSMAVREQLAGLLLAQGELAEAQRHYEAVLVVAEHLISMAHSNTAGYRECGIGHSGIGDVLLGQGDVVGARRHYEAGLRVREALATCDPENVDWQCDLCASEKKLGDVLQLQGDLAGAQQRYEVCLRIHEALVARDPESIIWLREMVESRLALGGISGIGGDEPGRQMHWGQARRIMRKLVNRWPDNPQFCRDLEMIDGWIKESKLRRFL